MTDEIEKVWHWEGIISTETEWTERLKVDGGYIYSRVIRDCNGSLSTTCVFVPDVDLTRYQAHMRDAYNQGFKDGGVDAHAQYAKIIDVNELMK